MCKQNVRRNELNARVTCVQADALAGPPPSLWDFDVIACNPPYIPTGDIAGLDVSVRDYEPRLALDGGDDGLDFYRAIAAKWGTALRLGGILLFEVGIGQASDVEQILARSGYEDIETFQDTRRHLAGGGGDGQITAVIGDKHFDTGRRAARCQRMIRQHGR